LFVAFLTWQVDGLIYLHRVSFVHRDIKPENVLIGSGNIAKICDFRAACRAGKRPSSKAGTIQYMAPEVHQADVCE
jgi:serine/threonine protein kinase